MAIYLAGDSWLSNAANTARIAEQTGQQVTNFAVGGSTTADTLKQLNSFIESGGKFDPNTTVMLDIGGNDLLQGASPESVKNNLEKIVSTLGKSGVNVVLSGAPAVGSVADVTGSTSLAMNNIFNDVAANNPNVTLVDAMSGLLNQKNLVDATGFHLNDAGQTAFNASLSNALLKSQGLAPIQYSNQDIVDFAKNYNLTNEQAVALAPYFGLDSGTVSSALSSAAGVPTSEVIARSAPNVSFTPGVELESGTSPGSYTINGVAVHPTYGTVAGTGGDDQNAGAPSGIVGYSSGVQHIGDRDYTAQYDASGNLLGYMPYAGESAFSSTVKPLLPIILSVIAPGLGEIIGGATGLTGANLAAATGATIGGGTAALTGQDVLKGALTGGALGYAGSQLNQALNAGVTDAATLQAAADADMAAGMLPEYGTNAAYDAAMADLMAGSPGAVQQLQNIVNDVTGVNADIAGGLIPDYGLTYDQVMADLMANSPGAKEQLQNIVDSQVGGTLGPDNIDVGGGWNPADTTDFSMEVTADRLPTDTVDYSNEGLNYPNTGTTQGAGGSPVNATTTTTTPSLNDVLNVVKAGTLVAGLTGAANADTGQTGFDVVPVPSDWKTPTYGQTGQWPALAPIDFGSRELLRGTQWEKYLQPQTLENVVNTISQQATPSYATPTYTPAPMEQIKTYADQPLTGIAAFKPTSMNDVINIINSDNNITNSEAQALTLLSNPNLSTLPPQAVSAIANAVGNPRSYQDVVSSGIATPSNLSGMSPEVQKAYELYQQSMVLGAPRSVTEAAYAAAGINPTSPDAFFEKLGLPTGTPTQEALAKYAPMALNQFAATGAGALTFTVDPSTIPAGYTPPNVPTLATKSTWSPMTTFDTFVNNQISNPNISNAAKQNLITKQAAKYGIDATPYLGLLSGQTTPSAVG